MADTRKRKGEGGEAPAEPRKKAKAALLRFALRADVDAENEPPLILSVHSDASLEELLEAAGRCVARAPEHWLTLKPS